ncbi:MAG TPA: iron-sulfur cluster assembly scaffold protein [Sphingomicrobium sp.]|nr:iron-sulfur cluster assembly scaffold protein [Sphingomicrobium sp.]
MNEPLYTLDILRLAASLPEHRPLARVDGSASTRSPTCGSTVRIDVQVDGEGRIEDLSQQVQACAFGQASAALVARQAAGHNAEQVRQALVDLESWLSGNYSEPPAWAGFEALAPARSRKSRHGAILLPLRALAAALESAV